LLSLLATLPGYSPDTSGYSGLAARPTQDVVAARPTPPRPVPEGPNHRELLRPAKAD